MGKSEDFDMSTARKCVGPGDSQVIQSFDLSANYLVAKNTRDANLPLSSMGGI